MRRLAPLLAAASLLATVIPTGQAAAEDRAAVRLIVAGVVDGRVEAGIAIDLPAGWKTYWRVPGDAGIPPTITTDGSQGLTPPVVRFPMPERFDEAGFAAIGYTRSVVLPIDTAPLDPKRPGRLDVAVMIGLCHDICVPFEAHLTATIDPAAAVDAGAATAIQAARARVPVAFRPGATPAVTGVRLERDAGGLRAVMDVAMPEGDAASHDVLVEGPAPDWSLPQPERRGAGGARETWAFAIDGLPKGATFAGSALTLTLKAGERAIEQVVRVDAAAPTP